jgi:hypothetical protein
LIKPFKVWIPTRQYWHTPGKITNPNMAVWFTDRSGISDRFDADVYGPLCNNKESIPMGSLCLVFSAEVIVILRCAELLVKNMIRRRIHICFDSRTSLAALGKTTTLLFWLGNACKC